MNTQASLLTAASHTAKVSGLKQRLEQDEEELGQVRWQPIVIVVYSFQTI